MVEDSEKGCKNKNRNIFKTPQKFFLFFVYFKRKRKWPIFKKEQTVVLNAHFVLKMKVSKHTEELYFFWIFKKLNRTRKNKQNKKKPEDH